MIVSFYPIIAVRRIAYFEEKKITNEKKKEYNNCTEITYFIKCCKKCKIMVVMVIGKNYALISRHV